MIKNLLICLAVLISCTNLRCCSLPHEDIYGSSIRATMYPNAHKSSQDDFHASTLIGVWQFDHNVMVGNYGLCEASFSNDGYCDIVMEDLNVANRDTKTFHWYINNGYLCFDSGSTYDERIAFSFKLIYYLYPILEIEDSFGKYEMKKVSTN